MYRARLLADGLTGFRFLIALYLPWLGVTAGTAALPTAVTALVLAWASDLADGPLARLDREGRPSWVGRRDLEADVSVSVGVLGYLTTSGYISWLVGLGYLLLSAALFWYFRSVHLAWALQSPPYVSLVYVALRDAWTYGLLAALWIAFTLVITWPRFPQTTLPTFFKGMRDMGITDEEIRDERDRDERP